MFKELTAEKEASVVSNSVTGQKMLALVPESKSVVRTGPRGTPSRKMWVYLVYSHAKATAPLWFDLLRHILKK